MLIFELFALRSNSDVFVSPYTRPTWHADSTSKTRSLLASGCDSNRDTCLTSPFWQTSCRDNETDKKLSPPSMCHYINHVPISISLNNESVANMLNAIVVSALYIQH